MSVRWLVLSSNFLLAGIVSSLQTGVMVNSIVGQGIVGPMVFHPIAPVVQDFKQQRTPRAKVSINLIS